MMACPARTLRNDGLFQLERLVELVVIASRDDALARAHALRGRCQVPFSRRVRDTAHLHRLKKTLPGHELGHALVDVLARHDGVRKADAQRLVGVNGLAARQ